MKIVMLKIVEKKKNCCAVEEKQLALLAGFLYSTECNGPKFLLRARNSTKCDLAMKFRYQNACVMLHECYFKNSLLKKYASSLWELY